MGVRVRAGSEADIGRRLEDEQQLEASGYLPEDILDWPHVPASVRDKLQSYRDLKADRHAALVRSSDERSATREELQKAESRLHQLRTESDNRVTVGADHPELAALKTRIERFEATLARVNARTQELSESYQAAARLSTNMERYIREHGAEEVSLLNGDLPQLKNGERALDGVERAARRTRTLQADRNEILASPFPSSMAKQLARQQLANLIEAAAPDVEPLVYRGEPIEFPLRRVPVSQYGGSAAVVNLNDHIGLLAWLFQKQFEAAIDKAIDAASDDKAALTIEQRIAKLAEIDGDILASERDEARFAELAGQLPRSTIDPRAALGLSAAMPAPKRD